MFKIHEKVGKRIHIWCVYICIQIRKVKSHAS